MKRQARSREETRKAFSPPYYPADYGDENRHVYYLDPDGPGVLIANCFFEKPVTFISEADSKPRVTIVNSFFGGGITFGIS